MLGTKRENVHHLLEPNPPPTQDCVCLSLLSAVPKLVGNFEAIKTTYSTKWGEERWLEWEKNTPHDEF